MTYAPVVLTVFNRPEHTKKVLEALSKNKLAPETDLYIFADGPRNEKDTERTEAVKEVISNIIGFKSVTVNTSKENRGLATNVISSVTQVVNKHGKVIVLEDDLLTTPNYLSVMNQMLDFYQDDQRIAGVSGYMHSTRIMEFPKDYNSDVFFNIRACSYGWGVWKDRWEEIDWDIENLEVTPKIKEAGDDLVEMVKSLKAGKINSWAVRWTAHCLKNDLVVVQPKVSYIDNVGFDDSGTHTKNDSYYYLQTETNNKYPLDLVEFPGKVNRELAKRYVAHANLSWIYIKRKLSTILGITLP